MIVFLASHGLAEAAPWQVDGSSLALNAGRWVVRAAVECPEAGARTLGVAAVVYSRKQGTMAWGHSSLRTVRCRQGELLDREYEVYRLAGWNEQMFLDEHRGEPYADPEHLRQYRGALVLFRNPDPVDGGWFGEAQAHNREIYELWLDLPQQDLDRIAEQAERWYEEQRETLLAGGELAERYRALSTNCTAVLARLLSEPLGLEHPPTLPFGWMRLLEERAFLRVLHPSHALAARWGQLPEVTPRPHPIFRRKGPLPVDLAVPTTPIGPWSTNDPPRTVSEIAP